MGEGADAKGSGLLRGAHVELRPIEQDDLPLLHRWRNDLEMTGPYDTPRPGSLEHVRRRYLDKPAVAHKEGELLIVRVDDGVPVGTVQYHGTSYGGYARSYNIGISVAPDQRGRGYGSEAQRLLADFLFFAFPIGRVEAGTDVENVAEQRALERAGFRREGVARSAQWRGGRWHDMVLYGRIREDE